MFNLKAAMLEELKEAELDLAIATKHLDRALEAAVIEHDRAKQARARIKMFEYKLSIYKD